MCGFWNSTLVMVPIRVTGFLESNSAANEWCAHTGAAVQESTQAATNTPSTLRFIIALRSRHILHLSSRKEKDGRWLFARTIGSRHTGTGVCHRKRSVSARRELQPVTRISLADIGDERLRHVLLGAQKRLM